MTPRQRRRVWAGVRVGVVGIVVVPRGVARARVVVVAAVRAVGTVGAPRSRAIAGAVRSVSPGRSASAVAVAVAVAVAIVVNRAAEEQNAEQAEGAPLPCCE